MTKISNGNDNFKEQRKVKITENEHICKNWILHIWSAVLLDNFKNISHNVFLLLLLILNR